MKSSANLIRGTTGACAWDGLIHALDVGRRLEASSLHWQDSGRESEDELVSCPASTVALEACEPLLQPRNMGNSFDGLDGIKVLVQKGVAVHSL